MLIHITDKLNKKLKIGPLGSVKHDIGAHLRWYANVFTAQRAQYIITTNAASLFTVVMYGSGITDGNRYIKQFLHSIGEHLLDLDMRMILERAIWPHTDVFTFCKTSDRSVLGSMNDMANVCKCILGIKKASPWDLAREINNTPYGALKYRCPVDAFRYMPLDEV